MPKDDTLEKRVIKHSTAEAPFGFLRSGAARLKPTADQMKILAKHNIKLEDYAPGAKPPARLSDEHREKAKLNIGLAAEKAKTLRALKHEIMAARHGADWQKTTRFKLSDVSNEEAIQYGKGDPVPIVASVPIVTSAKSNPKQDPAEAKLNKVKIETDDKHEAKNDGLARLTDVVTGLIADVRESRLAAAEVESLVKSEAHARALELAAANS